MNTTPAVRRNEKPTFVITMWDDENNDLCSTTRIDTDYTEAICETIAGMVKVKDYFGRMLLSKLNDVITEEIMEGVK